MSNTVTEYNELIEEWNEQYGHICKGMKVERDSIQDSTLSRVKTAVLSDSLSEKRKVKMTMTTIGDFADLAYTPSTTNPSESYTRGELAYIIVLKSEELINERF